MAVKIGISPIAWQNDDLPDLTAPYNAQAETVTEQLLTAFGMEGMLKLNTEAARAA